MSDRPARTQAELLALIRSTQPEDYIDGLLAGAGGELLYAVAATGARVSEAVARSFAGLAPSLAGLGSRAIGYLSLSRTGTAAGDLLAGTVLADINGERVRLLDDATWAFGDATAKTVRVQSWARSYQANLAVGVVLGVREAVQTTPGVLFDATLIGTVLDAGIAEGGAATGVGLSGGTPPDLAACGDDRGLVPQSGEMAEQFRDRFRAVADTVSLAAVRRAVAAIIPEARVLVGIDVAAFVGMNTYMTDEMDLSADNAAPRVFAGPHVTNNFIVLIPPEVGGVMFWYMADDANAVGCGAYIGLTTYVAPVAREVALDFDGAPYDIGQTGIRPEAVRIAAAVAAAAPAGALWGMEEAAHL